MKKRILLVEDNPATVDVILKELEFLGYESVVAQDGKEAVEKASSYMPDLIIMDISMPAGDGLSACRMLASDARLQSVPVIILTGRSDDEIRRQVGAIGAHYVLKSPDSWQEIKPVLRRLLDLEPKTATATDTQVRTDH